MLIRETESLRIESVRTSDNNNSNSNSNNNGNNSNIYNNNNNNRNDKNVSLTELKDQNDIENTEKELNWMFCYHNVLTLIKPAFFKLLRGVTAVGSVLTGMSKQYSISIIQ